MTVPDPTPSVRPLLFGLPRLATSFINVGVITLALPVAVLEVAGVGSKGLHLGLITAAAALISIAVLFILGRYSDEHRARYGRRRYPLYGLALALAPLSILVFDAPYPLLVAAIIGLVAARSVIEGSHLPLLVEYDGFGATHRYTAAIAFYQVLGAGGGAVIFSYFAAPFMPGAGVASVPAAAGIVVVIAAMVGYRASVHSLPGIRADWPAQLMTEGEGEIPAMPARESGLPPHAESDIRRFRLSPELRLLLLARLFFLAGILIVSTYLVFVVADVMEADDVARVSGRLFAIAVAGGLLFALPSRRLTGSLGEIRTLLLAGAILALAAALFVLVGGRWPWVAGASMLLYGAGFITVISAGLSLTVRLIARRELAGRIMAVVIASTFASQFLASMVGAALLDPLNRLATNAGYYGLLLATEICFALGAFFLLRLSATRHEEASPLP